ncbi:MAG: XrtA system polysaccharide deacetylase [Myxococcota bacterium]
MFLQSTARTQEHFLSFDVEEHFQVNAFESPLRRRHWDVCESRVERNTEKLLALLARHRYRATFFVLGWIAERHRHLVRRIAAQGHEVASHGYGHELITGLTRDAFRADVQRAKRCLEDLIGAPVCGYRAPSFTIVRETRWALEVLVEEGHSYDSSVVPIVHDVYGMRGADPHLHRIDTPAGSIWELPPSTARWFGTRIPVGGGGYFRLYPYALLRHWLRRIEAQGQPVMFYLHPWELDPEQPRMSGPRLSTFRHYLNLDRVEARLERLLDDFRFTSVRELLPDYARRWERLHSAPAMARLARARAG